MKNSLTFYILKEQCIHGPFLAVMQLSGLSSQFVDRAGRSPLDFKHLNKAVSAGDS